MLYQVTDKIYHIMLYQVTDKIYHIMLYQVTDKIYHLQLPIQSVPITTKVVSSNPAHGEVYLIQQYVINFVSDLIQHYVINFVSDLIKYTSPQVTDKIYHIMLYQVHLTTSH
jgi:hypothetical protein